MTDFTYFWVAENVRTRRKMENIVLFVEYMGCSQNHGPALATDYITVPHI